MTKSNLEKTGIVFFFFYLSLLFIVEESQGRGTRQVLQAENTEEQFIGLPPGASPATSLIQAHLPWDCATCSGLCIPTTIGN